MGSLGSLVTREAKLVLSAPEFGEGEDPFFGNLLLDFGCDEGYGNEITEGREGT